MTIDPMKWLAKTIVDVPPKRYHTRWFPGTVAPVHKGFYERHFTDSFMMEKPFMHYWDGKVWRSGKGFPPHWRQVGDYPAWRGLTFMGHVRRKGRP